MTCQSVQCRRELRAKREREKKCAMNIHVIRTDAPVRAHAQCATRTSPEKSKSWLLYARGACGALLPRAPFAPPVRVATGARRVQQRRTIHVRALAWPSVLMPPLVHARVDRARAASIISYPIFGFFVFLQKIGFSLRQRCDGIIGLCLSRLQDNAASVTTSSAIRAQRMTALDVAA